MKRFLLIIAASLIASACKGPTEPKVPPVLDGKPWRCIPGRGRCPVLLHKDTTAKDSTGG